MGSLLLLGAGGRAGGGGGGGGGGAEATAFLARTSGLDATHTNAYIALIDGLVADAIWAKLDMLHVYATDTSTNALLNLVSTSFPGTVNGAPTFTADRGYTGGVGKWIDPAFNPTTASSPLFVQNSAHVSVWSVTNIGTDSGPSIGQDHASGETDIFPLYTDNNTYFRINSSAIGGVAAATSQGHFIANRSTSSAVQGYRNGSSILSNGSATSTAPLNATIITLGVRHLGGGQTTGNHQIAMASIGSSMNGTEAGNFYTRLRTYMTAVGVP